MMMQPSGSLTRTLSDGTNRTEFVTVFGKAALYHLVLADGVQLAKSIQLSSATTMQFGVVNGTVLITAVSYGNWMDG